MYVCVYVCLGSTAVYVCMCVWVVQLCMYVCLGSTAVCVCMYVCMCV